jgi:hypothetical protein
MGSATEAFLNQKDRESLRDRSDAISRKCGLSAAGRHQGIALPS